jgi:uncharacterized protein YcbK (DUF882 family)
MERKFRFNPKSTLTIWAATLLFILCAANVRAQAGSETPARFFHGGDGHLRLLGGKSGKAFSGNYRLGSAGYDEAALAAIGRVFGAPSDPPGQGLSLRLIEFLDFLEDRLRPGAKITITSGYRAPQYNTRLRQRGALAAKASLHQYGMACDLKMQGVSARRIFDYVKALGFGGVGYYHGDTVHIDVGPARSWDEKTSGVGTDISDDNKLIGLVTNFDIYRPGEELTLRFIRMTAFPIGVSPEFALERQTVQGAWEKAAAFHPVFAVTARGNCQHLADIGQMASIGWQLPADLPGGRYRIRAGFCENPWSQMPLEISTPPFECRSD